MIPLWTLWLVVAIGAAIGELFTVDLFLASVAVAATLAAVVSLFLPATVTVLLFCAVSLIGILVMRPMVKEALHIERAGQVSGPVTQRHIVNRRAVVTREVNADSGQVRVGVGEFWSARSFDAIDVFPVGATVEVVVVDNITALVAPVRQEALLESPETVEKGT